MNVPHAIVLPSSRNPKNVLLKGDGISCLKPLVGKEASLSDYAMTYDDTNERLLTRFYKEEMTVVHACHLPSTGSLEKVESVTLELAMFGFDRRKKSEQVKRIYAIVPAHLILTKKQMETLYSDHVRIDDVRMEVGGKATHTGQFIQIHNRMVEYDLHDLKMFAYWHYGDQDAKGNEAFLCDICVLELEHKYSSDDELCKFLKEKMTSITHNTAWNIISQQLPESIQLGPIVRVENEETLQLMALRRVLVTIAGRIGHMTLPPASVGSGKKEKYLTHVAFTTHTFRSEIYLSYLMYM